MKTFEEAWSKNKSALMGYALKLTRNTADAEDLVAETAIRAFRYWGSFKQDVKPITWFGKIMSNCWSDTIRKRKRRGDVISLEDAAVPHEECMTDKRPSPLDELIVKDRSYRFRSILGNESVMRADGYSYEEIARKMNIPKGTVRSRLNRQAIQARRSTSLIQEL
jgi:RNA polymerase sigma-70 factor (ECF subfamily)